MPIVESRKNVIFSIYNASSGIVEIDIPFTPDEVILRGILAFDSTLTYKVWQLRSNLVPDNVISTFSNSVIPSGNTGASFLLKKPVRGFYQFELTDYQGVLTVFPQCVSVHLEFVKYKGK